MLPGSPSSRSQQFLVGRQQELLELQRHLTALRDRQGSLAIIGGEAGVGKTTLVDELTALASTRGTQVFAGHCYDLETTPPYGPWLNSGILDVRSDEDSPDETLPQAAPVVTPGRQQILDFLVTNGPARPSEVAEALRISANAATQALRRLLADELVTRPAYGVYAAVDAIGATLPSTDGLPDEGDETPPGGQPVETPGASAEQGTRQSLYREMWDRIVARAERGPVVLVLEDMHWADQASVELLRYVVRKVSSEPVLIIVTYRDIELSPDQPLYKYLPHIVREGNTLRIGLRRLDNSDIRDLLARRYALPRADEARLLRHIQRYTDGNPFFINEVLLTMEQDLQLSHRDGGWRLVDLSDVHIPPLVRQVIDGRLEHLSEQDRHLLQIAAVIGSEVPLSLLQEVSGATDEEALETIERAVDVHLLETVPTRPVVRFRHALVREAVYRSIITLRSRMLHRRVADALLRQPIVDPDAVANHLQQASDERASEWLIRAGERAARQFAWIGAVERFQAALELLPETPETAMYRAWLHYHIGQLSRRSNADVSASSLQAATEIARREGDHLLLGLSIAAAGLSRSIFGEIRSGLAEIERGVEILESLDPGELERSFQSLRGEDPLSVRLPLPDPASQRGLLIHWLAVAGRYSEAIEMGNQFVDRIPPRPHGSDLILHDDYYDAYLGLGHAYNMRAQPVEAADALNKVHSGYSNPANLPLQFLQYSLMHLIYFNLDQPSERDRVEHLITSVWESHRGMSDVEIVEGFRPPRLLYWYGEWDEVDRIAREWASRSGTASTRLVGLGLGMIARHRGQIEEAWSWTNAALNRQTEDSFGDCWCELAMQAHRMAADLSLDAGDFDEARRWIETHAEFLDRSGARLGRAQHHLVESRYHELLGEYDATLDHARQSLEYASTPHQPLDRLKAHRIIGHLLTRKGSYSDAEEHLSTSYDLATKCAARFEIALTCHAQAELLIGNGKLAGARHKLSEARSIASELRAQPFLERLSELSDSLAELTGKQSRPGGLSPRELEVLQLVARGLTDAEIAEQLFVSPRTVSGHLQSIYGKLGISSRAAATAYAYTQNLV